MTAHDSGQEDTEDPLVLFPDRLGGLGACHDVSAMVGNYSSTAQHMNSVKFYIPYGAGREVLVTPRGADGLEDGTPVNAAGGVEDKTETTPAESSSSSDASRSPCIIYIRARQGRG